MAVVGVPGETEVVEMVVVEEEEETAAAVEELRNGRLIFPLL